MSETKVKEKKMNLEKGFSRVRTVTGIVAKEQESKGNHQAAKLISLAPDMLNKLKSLQNWIKSFPENAGIPLPDHVWGELQDQFRLLEIIIKKAEGKEQ